jgi:hypothetical protein
MKFWRGKGSSGRGRKLRRQLEALEEVKDSGGSNHEALEAVECSGGGQRLWSSPEALEEEVEGSAGSTLRSSGGGRKVWRRVQAPEAAL